MKKLILILTSATILVFSSCEIFNTVDEKRNIVHRSVVVYVDSFVIPDAEFIEYDNSTYYCNPGSEFEKFIICEVPTKVVFNKEENISMRYVGGAKSDVPPVYNPDDIDLKISPGDSVVYDTIYEHRIVDLSYAILEITEGNKIRTDTAYFYQTDEIKKVHDIVHYDLSELNYKDKFRYIFSTLNETDLLGDYYFVNDTGESNLLFYMLDIYPYWKPVTDCKIVYYVYQMPEFN